MLSRSLLCGGAISGMPTGRLLTPQNYTWGTPIATRNMAHPWPGQWRVSFHLAQLQSKRKLTTPRAKSSSISQRLFAAFWAQCSPGRKSRYDLSIRQLHLGYMACSVLALAIAQEIALMTTMTKATRNKHHYGELLFRERGLECEIYQRCIGYKNECILEGWCWGTEYRIQQILNRYSTLSSMSGDRTPPLLLKGRVCITM